MKTIGLQLRRGAAILQHIIDKARKASIAKLNLETGYFRPAVALYKCYGFVECEPFADIGPIRTAFS
jgi:putative acetyltransferase